MGEFSKAALIAAIEKAGTKEKIVEFEYPYLDGLYFEIAFASKQVLKRITDESKENFFNHRTRQQEDRINDKKFGRASSRELLKGWRGLTVEKLRVMFPTLEFEGEEGAEVSYDQDLAYILLDNSMELQNWVVNVAQTISNFAKVAEKKAEQLENLG
jgi:hypothetical protein